MVWRCCVAGIGGGAGGWLAVFFMLQAYIAGLACTLLRTASAARCHVASW